MVSFNLRIFRSCRLQYGQAPAEFRLLPVIGRARYHWLYTVIDRTFTSGDVDLRAHLFIDHQKFFFIKFHGWLWPWNYLNSEIFLIYGKCKLHVNNSYIPQMEQHVAPFQGPASSSLAVWISRRGEFRTASDERAGPGNEAKQHEREGQIASFPGSPGTQICIAQRAWYLLYVSMM